MIQRIQTVYLLLAVTLCFVSLFVTEAEYFVEGQIAASFGNFVFSGIKPIESGGTWALGVLLLLTALIDMLAIVLFRHRMRQLRLVIFSTILLVGYVAVYVFYAWLYLQKIELATHTDADFTFPLVAVFPLVCVILHILAIHGIRKDEALVRSLDRLR